MMKTNTTTAIIAVVIAIVLVCLGFWLGRKTIRTIILDPKTTIDTVIIRETIRDTVLIPKIKYIARADTVYLPIAGDTVKVQVEVPIERVVYQTEHYKATIEGFRPSLVDMEIYRQTQYITQTQTVKVPDKRRWGLGVQAGYGYIPTQNKFYPYIGVGIQYSIITW